MYKIRLISVIGIILFCFFMTNAQVNLMSGSITFRDYNNAAYQTTHYGDFWATGGSEGNYRGWIMCNGVISYGPGYWYNDLLVYGNFWVLYDKDFLHPHPSDTTKAIAYVAVESGEALTLARGTATTVGGRVDINLPEHFSLVTSPDAPLTVLITPENVPALLYVKQKSKERLSIVLKSADYAEFGDVKFSYQVTGVRDCFENHTAICDIKNLNDTTKFSPKRKAYNAKAKSIGKQIQLLTKKDKE